MERAEQTWPALAGPKMPADLQARLWMERPIALLEAGKASHGALFELTLGAVGRVAIVAAPDLIAEALAVPRAAYKVGPFNQNYAPVMGDHGLFLLDGAPHRRLKRMLAPLFRNRALSGRAEIVAEETRAVLAQAVESGGADVPLRAAAHEITVRAFLRAALGADHALIAQVVALLRDQVWTDLRQWKAWARLARLRPVLRGHLEPEIAARRAAPGCGDLLDEMVQMRDDAGAALTDEEIFDSFMSFLGTAGDGTSIMLSWALDHLARAPEWQAKIAEEDPSGPRPALEATVLEVLRLQPLLPTVSGRVLERDIVLGGRRIEAGVALAPCLWLLHRDPELWPEPSAFRPERFMGGARPAPHRLMPFGGKERACLGQSLGRLTLAAALDAAARFAELTPGSDAPPAPTRFATMLAVPQDHVLTVRPKETRPHV